jgi:acyl carrier protein
LFCDFGWKGSIMGFNIFDWKENWKEICKEVEFWDIDLKGLNMGVDILDIVFNIEKKYCVTIERSDLIPDEVLAKSQGKSFDEYTDRFTVKFLCDLVERKIREKNEGILFPNVLQEVGDSVREILSKQFNIPEPVWAAGFAPEQPLHVVALACSASRRLERLQHITDTTRITNELSLGQLADLAGLPVSGGFWRRFRKGRQDDTDELKMIKSYLISREYISAFKTLVLLFGITFVFFVWFFIADWSSVDVLKIGAVLSCILFGIRAIVNWARSGSRSRITVADIINYIVDKKRDHSVRADGQPYSREEIEQGISDILCDCLALKPEKITPDARIIKDLGAE